MSMISYATKNSAFAPQYSGDSSPFTLSKTKRLHANKTLNFIQELIILRVS